MSAALSIQTTKKDLYAWQEGQGFTVGQLRRLTPDDRGRYQLRFTVEKAASGLPVSWVNALHDEWSQRINDASGPYDNSAAAWGFGAIAKIKAAGRAGVAHGDNDHDICMRAIGEAKSMRGMLDAVAVRVGRALAAVRPVEWLKRVVVRLQSWVARGEFERRGLADLLPVIKPGSVTRRGLVARVVCDRWWRRALRKVHALMLESQAINLGLVRKDRACYVSQESLKRRCGQLARNHAALEGTACVNANGEEINLAEVAARGVADKAVRRAELMTRISGFEVIANGVGHAAQFITITCPSRMHKWVRGDDRLAKPNRKYDGTLPNAAQAYLSGQWAKFRSAARHAGLDLYGFRIAEPHHDGCPHWHMLLWHAGLTSKGEPSVQVLHKLLRRYFLLNDSATESGAEKYRIKVEAIDPKKGSAVAYVAKYVAKNIDGYKVGRDLYGNDAMESSARVEAWASTWRIRQFQQIGGAPVGVWRELRRVRPDVVPMDAPQALHDALMMVNVDAVDRAMGGGAESEQDDAHRIRMGWAAYVGAQGGPFVKRSALRVRVLREVTGELNRYGDAGQRKTAGVVAYGVERHQVGLVSIRRDRVDEVESERLEWLVVPKSGAGVAHAIWDERRGVALAAHVKKALDVAFWTIEHGLNLEAKGEALRPWTRVNNCAQPDSIGGVKVVRTRKVGEVYRWPGRSSAVLGADPAAFSASFCSRGKG